MANDGRNGVFRDLFRFWPILLVLLGQTVSATWWAATITAELNHIKTSLHEIQQDQQIEAMRIRALERAVDKAGITLRDINTDG